MEQQTYEGTPAQLAAHILRLPDARFQMTVVSETAPEDAVESLEAALDRMVNRSPAEVEAARERILAASPPPRELPEGKTLLDVIMGKWPGDETDEQIREALDRLS